jgi:methionyl-tRNA synthetase
VEEISDSLGTNKGQKYRSSTTPVDPLRIQWQPSELKPGQKLKQPIPLFKKLDESVIEEERARIGK